MANKTRGEFITWATRAADVLAAYGVILSADEFREVAALLGAGVSDQVLEMLEELRIAGQEGRIAGINWQRPPVGDHAGEVDGEPLRPGPRMYLQVVIDIPAEVKS